MDDIIELNDDEISRLDALDTISSEIVERHGRSDADEVKTFNNEELTGDNNIPDPKETRSKLEKRLTFDVSDNYSNVKEEKVEDKLARIRKELESIKSNEDIKKENEKEIEMLENMCLKLSKEKTDHFNTLLRRLNEENSKVELHQIPNIRFDVSDTQRLLKMEAKVRDLEDQIGVPFNEKGNLVAQINEIYRHLNLLNDKQQMDDLIENLRNMNKEFEESFLGRQVGRDANIIHNLNTVDTKSQTQLLYDAYLELGNYEETIPLMITRLREMNGIHNNLKSGLDTIDYMKEMLEQMDIQSKRWESLVTQVNDKFDLHELEQKKKFHEKYES